MTGSGVTAQQGDKLYCFRQKDLDGVSKVIHQLCDVVETLNSQKAESTETVVVPSEPQTTEKLVVEAEPVKVVKAEPVKEKVTEAKVEKITEAKVEKAIEAKVEKVTEAESAIETPKVESDWVKEISKVESEPVKEIPKVEAEPVKVDEVSEPTQGFRYVQSSDKKSKKSKKNKRNKDTSLSEVEDSKEVITDNIKTEAEPVIETPKVESEPVKVISKFESEPVKETPKVEVDEVSEPTQSSAKKSKKSKKNKRNKETSLSEVEDSKEVITDNIEEVVSNMNQVEETPKINDVKEFTEVVIDNKDIIEKVIEQIKEPVKEIKCKLPDLDTVVKTKDALCTGMTGMTISGGEVSDVAARLGKVESENTQLRTLLTTLESRLNKLEGGKPATAAAPAPAPAKPVVKAPEPAKKVEEDDDDFDMFGDEEDDEEVAKRNAERIAEYHAKKAAKGKPAVIAKSSILLDCKPWDDETDMKELENKVRSIEMEGLKWNQNSKLVTVAYGLKKLQIGCVIVDDLVSTEALEELILEFEDHCQSVDIAAFNKI